VAKKMLFVNMPNTAIDDYAAAVYVLERQTVSNLPYGLLSICSTLGTRSRGEAEVRIFDLNDQVCQAYAGGSVDTCAQVLAALQRTVNDFRPDLVGISVMFNVSYMYLGRVVAAIRRTSVSPLIVVGGNLATSLYEEILQNQEIDTVCYGEGELTVARLADADDLRAAILEIPSLVTREKLAAGARPVNAVVQDLDSLPPIDFGFIDLSRYRGPMTRFFQRADATAALSTLVIYTTRGCPYRCSFCACHVVHGRKVRFMSVDKVMSDVRQMIDRHGISCLMVNDDNFLIDRSRAKTILGQLAALGLTVVFPSLLIAHIDEEIAALLAQVGVTNQLVSIESGSDYVLRKLIHKPLKKAQISAAVENMRRYGISVDTNVVIGFPGETDEHRQETLRTIEQAGFNWAHFLIVLPVPGSSLYRECKEKGYLINDDNFYSPNLSQCNIRTPDYEPEHIQDQAYLMNLHANFVHNYNLRTRNYDECILHFHEVLRSVPDHAFAHHGLMRAYESKEDGATAEIHRTRFEAIVHADPFWRRYAETFGLV
jgi:anaerobic magnesium-protoporphyrin IX monomethyl ester cyclase